MAKLKQKQKIVTTGLVIFSTIFVAAFVFLASYRWHLDLRLIEGWLIVPLGIVTALLVVLLNHLLQPLLYHDNNQLSRLVYKVFWIEKGKEVSPEKKAELEDKLLAFAQANPDLRVDAHRYLGDLAFAMMETDKAIKYYQKAINEIEPNTDQYYYVFNRIAAGLLRLGNYQLALQEFEYLAKIKPCYSVGLAAMYEFGWGVECDLKKANYLYKQAAQDGNDYAVVNLFETRWRLSHQIPDSEIEGYAAYMLKWHDQEGFLAGVPALTESAEAGYAPSQYELGTLYMEGKLGKNKASEAFHWLRKGADQDYPPALHNLGFLVQMRCMDPIRGNVNKPKIPGTLLFDNDLRLDCYDAGKRLILQAAEGGFAPSQHSVGATLLREGNREKAKPWLRLAARQGYKKAIDDYEKYFGKPEP